MSRVDLLILAGLVVFLVRGLIRGFVGELAPVVRLAAAAAAGVAFAREAALWAAGQWSWAAGLPPGLLVPLAGAACFGSVYAACRLAALLLAVADGAPEGPRGFARAGGALLGLAKGALLVGFALLGFSWLLTGSVSHRLFASSVLARELTRVSGSLLTWAYGWL